MSENVGNSEGSCAAGDVDERRLCAALSRRRLGFAVPPWSVPRAGWRLLLAGPVAYQSAPLHDELARHCSLVRCCDCVPAQWATSWTAFADKQNGKSGCGRWRLLQLLDPVGSAWNAALWAGYPHPFDDFQYENVKGRQRLHAALQVRIQRWRIAQRGDGCLGAYYDATNAFPSMRWRELQRATLAGAPDADRSLLCKRFSAHVAGNG